MTRILSGFALAFLLLQFVRSRLIDPLPTSELQVPFEVKQILRTSCYPCHSSESRLSWFDRIVPAYQLVVHDVNQARAHLNLSELGAQPVARQRAVLFEAVNQIQMGAMPLPRYLRLHHEAAVSAKQLAVLREYLLPPSTLRRPVPDDANAAPSQYRQWIAAAGTAKSVQNSSNGIAFLPDYKNCQSISTTNRMDTSTMRVILGNDVAVRAVAEQRINPWPDGTTFAKVAWRQQPDDNGVSQTGRFIQVAFMIKDKVKYASTAGWGWAEWVGTDLKPYGTTPDFAHECVACHAPLRDNDYVFTMPIPLAEAHR